jgi:uncharacterized protein (DUF1330 family)
MRVRVRPLTGRVVVLVATFGAGVFFGSVAAGETTAEPAPQATPPGFIIGVTRTLSSDPDALGPYSRAAGPLAAEAGLSYVARTPEVRVLEGEFPFEGTVMIEQFNSLQSILDFWYSDGYQEAKKLREGIVDVDFLIAVEGVAR